MHRVSRTRRRTCWRILSWPAGDGPQPARLISLRGRGGALGTADGDGKLLDHPQLGGDFCRAKHGRRTAVHNRPQAPWRFAPLNDALRRASPAVYARRLSKMVAAPYTVFLGPRHPTTWRLTRSSAASSASPQL